MLLLFKDCVNFEGLHCETVMEFRRLLVQIPFPGMSIPKIYTSKYGNFQVSWYFIHLIAKKFFPIINYIFSAMIKKLATSPTPHFVFREGVQAEKVSFF